MGNTITVDINHLEKEIQEKTAELEKLKSFLSGVKTYGHISVNGNGKKKPGRKVKGKKVVVTTPTGISEWLLSFLAKEELDTKTIVIAWAAKVNKTYSQVYNSVSNALQRLKALNRIDSKMDERGRRFGSTWFLK